MRSRISLSFGALAVLVLGACGNDSGPEATDSGDDRPSIVVTTTILGDVVANLVGDLADVETILPAGSDPHDFQASAQQVNAMHQADVLVVNGAGFEEGLLDQLESAEADGTPVCAAIDGVDTLHAGGSTGHDFHAESEDHDEDHDTVDPHFFTDPARMAEATGALVDCIATNADGINEEELRRLGREYAAELEALDAEVEDLVATVPVDRRVMVTNHEVFAYFADRYGFEIAGAILPSTTTQSQADAAALAALAELVREGEHPAVFTESSSPDELAETLAAEGGDVEVVTLFSESLGPDGGETYRAMVLTNAERITEALR